MGELIELFFKAVVWLFMLAAYLFVHAARLFVLVATWVIKVTIALVQQANAKTRSPDGRYWWNGRTWVPMLSPANWAIPITALSSAVIVGIRWKA